MKPKSHNTAQKTSPEEIALMFAILTEVNMVFHRSSAEFNQLQEHELHMSHFSILNRLFRFGDAQTPQALAKGLAVTRATMTSSLKKLSDAGLIEVLDNPKDKRSKLVFLTARGKRAREQAIENIMPKMKEYAAPVGTKRLKELLELLRHLHQSINPDYESSADYQ